MLAKRLMQAATRSSASDTDSSKSYSASFEPGFAIYSYIKPDTWRQGWKGRWARHISRQGPRKRVTSLAWLFRRTETEHWQGPFVGVDKDGRRVRSGKGPEYHRRQIVEVTHRRTRRLQRKLQYKYYDYYLNSELFASSSGSKFFGETRIYDSSGRFGKYPYRKFDKETVCILNKLFLFGPLKKGCFCFYQYCSGPPPHGLKSIASFYIV